MMRTPALVLLVAAVLFTAWRWGSFVAGGSDSSCYATQAIRWADVLAHPLTASNQTPNPLARTAPWPDAASTFAPTGHVPSKTVAGAFVPICPAGLSLAMAPLYLLGGPMLMFAIVPILGAVLVFATYVVGSRFSARAGVTAAVLIAASPVFLYQLVQPMSDVPAAAFWAAAVACATGTGRRHASLAGVATSAAILMRPNLVPLGFVIGLWLLFRAERSWPQRVRSAVLFALWSAPGCLAVAAIQESFYGSPLASGYGSYEAIFSSEHIGPNLTRYAAWLWGAHTPAILIALLAPFLVPGALTALLLSLFVVNLAMFLPYVVFEDWSYLRFLLPTIPFVMVLIAAVLDAATVRLLRSGLSPGEPRRQRQAAVALVPLVAALGAAMVQQARARHAFDLQSMEARFATAGRFVAQRLPSNAILITDYQSGSVPFYSGRQTLAWRALDAEWLDPAIAFMREQGREPYLLFERWEEQEFRQRFAASPLGPLDWPPIAEVSTQVRIYRVADRDRYHAGLSVPTEYVR
jgi:hypothetical protein